VGISAAGRTRPSGRQAIIWTVVVILIATVSSFITALVAMTHYHDEHAAAVQARSQRSELVSSISRLEQVSNGNEKKAQDLQARLARSRTDLRYALRRWTSLKSKTAALQATESTLRSNTAALRDQVTAARAKASDSYNTGYDAGYADASGSGTPGAGTSASSGCDPNYEGACVPTGYDANCADVAGTDFFVVGVDVDGLDGDGDGYACES
jgi:hypothetical protein